MSCAPDSHLYCHCTTYAQATPCLYLHCTTYVHGTPNVYLDCTSYLHTRPCLCLAHKTLYTTSTSIAPHTCKALDSLVLLHHMLYCTCIARDTPLYLCLPASHKAHRISTCITCCSVLQCVAVCRSVSQCGTSHVYLHYNLTYLIVYLHRTLRERWGAGVETHFQEI